MMPAMGRFNVFTPDSRTPTRARPATALSLAGYLWARAAYERR